VLALALRPEPAGATEPDGALTLRYTWESPDRLQVTIQALVPLEEVVVTWNAPQGVALQAERVEGERTPEAVAGGERLTLGSLGARAGKALRLRVEREAGAGRIATVRVEALLRGRPIRETLGIPVTDGVPGRLRSGALEFEAAVEAKP
jgi:uncharacterized protein YndB with AHSA1/START domain